MTEQINQPTYVCCVPSYFRADGAGECPQPGKYEVQGAAGFWVCEWHAADFQHGYCPACGLSTGPGGRCGGHPIQHDHDGYLTLHLHERGIHERCIERCSKVNR